MSFPTKQQRSVCWNARDKYWECLDKIGEKNSVKEGPCVEFRKAFEQGCTSQWVTHFDRKRSYLQYKERLENEGYEAQDNEN